MRTLLTLMLCLTWLNLAGCTSLLTGASGTSAGRPIGQDSREAGTVAGDDRIAASIRARLRADPALAALTVQTRRGVVTLRGTVNEYGQRDRAVRLATDVAGVVRVQNQIAVNSR